MPPKASLKGQFLQGNPQKPKKPSIKSVSAIYDTNTTLSFRPNGWCPPKQGAI